MNFIKKTGTEQLENFKNLSSKVEEVYKIFCIGNKLSGEDVKTEWDNNVQKIKQMYTKKSLQKDFLHNSVISQAIFMNSQGDLMAHQLEFCKKYFQEADLKNILTESPIGSPQKALLWEYDTSHNSIHHLYHVARYNRTTKKVISVNKRIIEWGGGYGNFCKIVAALPKSELCTYTIVDLPEISSLQWVYLSSIFGKEKVNIVSKENKIKENVINLVSINNLEHLDDKYDLFVSTWALSESPVSMHEFVNNKNWFDASSMLMAIHQCGEHIPFMKESTNVGLLSKKFGAKIEDVKVIPGKNYYIFK